jgi:subtilisin-like proprotein convertase family protein
VYTTFPTINPTTCPGSTTCLNVAIAGGNVGATYNVTINANPGGNFTVNGYTSGNCIPVTPAVNTTYTLVSVIDASNPCCIGTGNSGNPTVVVTPGPVTGLQITANPNPPICSGDPTLLTVSGLPGSGSFTSAPITINAFGLATPYPQTLAVAGLPAGATVSSVQLNGFNHTWAGDVDIALSGPTYVAGGQIQTAMLLSDLGNDGFVNATNVNLKFQDGAPRVPTTSPMVSGTYSCTNDGAVTDAMPLPGPTTTVTNPLLTQLNAATMNGTWNMYINDQVGGDGGSVAGGFTINFSWPAAPPIGYTYLWSPAAGLSSTTGNPVAASPPVTRQYTVLGTAPGGCQTAATILITVNQLPAVVTNPTAVTLCDGGTATFTVGATGAGINYQWQVGPSAAGPWVALTNTAPYAGTTTATLTINPATVALNGNWYRCVISGTCPPNANSAAAKLTVNPLPTVTIAPASPVCGGVAGTNGTALTASGANTYVWAPIAGLYTNATATTAYAGGNAPNPIYAAPAVNTIYTVTGTTTATGCTNTATVNVVYTPPAPTVNPPSVTMCNGDPAAKLSITSSLAPSPFTASFTSGPINVPIPEGNFPAPPPTAGVSTINCSALPATAQITNIRVTMNITHNYVGDVIAVLKAPNGQVFNLDAILNKTNNPGSNFVNTVISSSGVTPLSSGTAPFTATFKADAVGTTFVAFGFTLQGGPVGYAVTTQSWNALYPNPSGNWTIAMYDAGAPDVGNLTSWSIAFDYLYGPPASGTWSPIFGLWKDVNLTNPYNLGDTANTVWARPLPFGVYPYQVTVQSQGFDAVPVFSNPNLVTIRDNNTANPYPSTITVSGVPAGATIENVKLNGFTHTWSGDVDVAITDPGGSGVILFSDLYGDALINASNVNLTFSDLASGPIPNSSPMASGTYQCSNFGTPDNFPAPGPQLNQPNPSLSLLNGRPRNGTWSLWVIDQVGGDFGTINNGWSISFRYPTPGCTSPARTVVVTVNTQPVVTAQPASTAVCTDKVATFTVSATIGLGTFTYQWQVSNDNGNTYNDITNGGVYSGATTATLTITQPPVSMNGYVYRCKLQGPAPCAPTYSFFRILTVYPLPTITITAAPYVKLFPGLRTVLSSTVSPYAAATYTWLRNGIAVSGGNTQSLNVDVDGLGDYTLRVTDVNGCTNISNTLSITDSVTSNCFLYPNPSSGKFQVRYYSVPGNVLPRTLTVYDAKGSRVLTQTFTITAPYARMDLNLTPFGKGVFWVELGDRNGSRIVMCRAVVD